MYKIYINEQPILLVDQKEGMQHIPGTEKRLVARYSGKIASLLNYIDLMEKNNDLESVMIFHHDREKLFSDFTDLFTVIEAGGGLVFNPENQILAIFRKGKWDLPKGKIEKMEAHDEGALREVQEETGLEKIHLENLLHISFHTYRMKEKRILKKTFWYSMKANQTNLIPQAEEDIEEARWVDPNIFLEKDYNTYKSVIDVIKLGITRNNKNN